MFRIRLRFRGLLFLAFLGLFFGMEQESNAEDVRMLFIGNSYTFKNDLELLEKEFLQRNPGWQSVFAKRVAPGGYRWEQHARDADGTNGNTTLRDTLVTSQDPLYKWDYGILQEQSQIPGFPQNGQYWKASLGGLKKLHALLQKKGAKTILLMTWGRRKGDSRNAARFKDFKMMQGHLTDGYRAFVAQAGSVQAPIYIAPVGIAFEKIHDDLVKASKDPLDSNSTFSQLYESDDSHPSLRGSYLAACVIYATITGRDPSLISWSPSQISASERKVYQQAARSVVLERSFGRDPFPWAFRWRQYPWPTDVQNKVKAISGVSVVPAVLASVNEGNVPNLSIGVTHIGGASGDGRLQFNANGALRVEGQLIVGDSGAGSLRFGGGSLRVKELILAKEKTSSGEMLVLAGRIIIQMMKVGQGKATWKFSKGIISFSSWDGDFVLEGGTFSPSVSDLLEPSIGKSLIKGNYTQHAGAGTYLDIETIDGSLPAGEGYDQIEVEGEATLGGSFFPKPTSKFKALKGDVKINVLIAKKITLQPSFKVYYKYGATFKIIDFPSKKQALQITISPNRDEPIVKDAGGELGPKERVSLEPVAEIGVPDQALSSEEKSGEPSPVREKSIHDDFVQTDDSRLIIEDPGCTCCSQMRGESLPFYGLLIFFVLVFLSGRMSSKKHT